MLIAVRVVVISEFLPITRPEYELEQLVSRENVDSWTSVYGERAHQWLATLPMLVAEYAEKWGLTINEPLEGGTVSVVIGAEQADAPVVLKIHPPWLAEKFDRATSAQTEASAFRIWDGEGAPRLLASDEQALLLEYITPAEHSPDMTAQDVAALVTQISRPIDMGSANLRLLGIPFMEEELWKRYARANARRPKEISTALLLNATIMAHCFSCYATPGPWELIHGDFKAKNVLKRSDGSFAVIDPNPAIGRRFYDVASWAIQKPRIMMERCAETAEYLKIDPQIIGSVALTLAIPEICLASPSRAQVTLECLKGLTGTNDLERYFQKDIRDDNFMTRSYTVIKVPDYE